jgi:hypothetical protein
MMPTRCPRFATCNANVCPVDANWRKAVHLAGEDVCAYLLLTGRRGADERYAGDPVYQVARRSVEAIGDRYPTIAWNVALAARRPLPVLRRPVAETDHAKPS